MWVDHGIGTQANDGEVNEVVAFGFTVAEFFRELTALAPGRTHARGASAEDAVPAAWDAPTFDATTALRESRVAPRVTERDDGLARSMSSSSRALLGVSLPGMWLVV